MLIPQVENLPIVLSAEVAINAMMDRTDHTVAELTTPNPLMVHIMRVSDVEYILTLGAELFTMFWDGQRLGLEHDIGGAPRRDVDDDDYDDDDDEGDTA